MLGVFWQHWFGLSEPEDRERANVGTLQVFYWFSMGGGWQVGGSPTATTTYLHEGNDFSFPLNLGVAKTLLLGSLPLKTTLQGQYFVTRPEEAGGDWGVFFQVSPVINVPWGR